MYTQNNMLMANNRQSYLNYATSQVWDLSIISRQWIKILLLTVPLLQISAAVIVYVLRPLQVPLYLQLLDAEQRARGMSADSVVLAELAAEASRALETAQSGLSTTCDELATLYHHVCTVNGETPSRVLLDHEKHLTGERREAWSHSPNVE